ncbi:hypothetical protein MRX96_056681 [Rhipicephalus microplus]
MWVRRHDRDDTNSPHASILCAAISHGLLLLRCYHQCFRGNDCYPSSPLRQHHGWSIVVLLEGFVGTSCRRFHACSSLEPSIRPPASARRLCW